MGVSYYVSVCVCVCVRVCVCVCGMWQEKSPHSQANMSQVGFPGEIQKVLEYNINPNMGTKCLGVLFHFKGMEENSPVPQKQGS